MAKSEPGLHRAMPTFSSSTINIEAVPRPQRDISRMCIEPYLFRLSLAAMLVSGLAACGRRDTAEDRHALAERLNDECRQSVGQDFLYQTAAGFQLAVPKWATGSLQPFQYGPDCELKNIRLVFAWVEGKLIPVQQGGLHRSPPDLVLPERFDSLVVMMSFKPPKTMVGPENGEYCKNNHPQFDYPEFKLRMCPQFRGEHLPSQSGFTLPYRARFEIAGAKYSPYSMTCDDSIFANVTTANVVEATTEYSCRGYWYWRPGAAGMFDFGSGTVLKKVHLVLPAAERMMDSWVVKEEDKKAQ